MHRYSRVMGPFHGGIKTCNYVMSPTLALALKTKVYPLNPEGLNPLLAVYLHGLTAELRPGDFRAIYPVRPDDKMSQLPRGSRYTTIMGVRHQKTILNVVLGTQLFL